MRVFLIMVLVLSAAYANRHKPRIKTDNIMTAAESSRDSRRRRFPPST